MEPERFHSKGRNTPFGGWSLTGRVMATVCGGRLHARGSGGAGDPCARWGGGPGERPLTRRPPALLALEDGRVFRGEAFGAPVETCGEVVFNTAMTGYQEVLSDPSYCGQIVTFTYPLIGNYGVNDDDMESAALRAQALICREVCERPSSWRSQGRLEDLLAARGVPGICGIDTRALTRHLRERGVMRGCLSSVDLDADTLVEKARWSPSMLGLALVDRVTCTEPYAWTAAGPAAHDDPLDVDRPLAVVFDFGVKWNILRRLRAEGFRVRVVPGRTPAARGARDGARRRGALERPRRSRAARLRDRHRARGGAGGADARHLPRPPAARAGVRRDHAQAQVRAPRRQPSGDRPAHRRRSRSRARTTASWWTPPRCPRASSS